MPSFSSGNTLRGPFGKNEYRRSNKGLRYESYTVAAASVVAETIDGNSEKVLQSGELIAKITSGTYNGKFGPFQASVTDGRQTAANIVGLNDTFLPWELNERDADVAVAYTGVFVQAWCFERNAAGARIALTNATRDALLALPRFTDVIFV
jgi:hypothetical protein